MRPADPVLPSSRPVDDDERALVELVRATIDAATDAGPGEDGLHTMGAACGTRTGGPSSG